MSQIPTMFTNERFPYAVGLRCGNGYVAATSRAEVDLRIADARLAEYDRMMKSLQLLSEGLRRDLKNTQTQLDRERKKAIELEAELRRTKESAGARAKMAEVRHKEHEHLQSRWASLQIEAGQLRNENSMLREIISSSAATSDAKDQKIAELELMIFQRNQVIYDLQEELSAFPPLEESDEAGAEVEETRVVKSGTD